MTRTQLALYIKIAISLAVTCLTLFGCGHREYTPPKQSTQLLITNVNIVDVKNRKVLNNHAVLIADDTIIDVGKSRNLEEQFVASKNTVVKNGNNGYLLPGLIDMHVHPYSQNALELSLSHGVTHMRIMNGVSQHLDWRERIESKQWLASSISVSSPIIRGDEQPLSWQATSEKEARALVNKAHQLGYDLIKAYGSLNQSALEGLLDEANKVGIPVAKHGPHPAPNMGWKKLHKIQSLEHTEDIYQGPLKHSFNKQELTGALNKISQTHTPITPTLNIYWQLTMLSADKQAFVDQLPEGYISPIIAYEDNNNQVQRWLTSSPEMAAHNQKTLAFLKHITGQLDKSGIEILVGSDAGVLLSPFGLATLNEMKLLEQSGLSRIDVIRSATLLPAKALAKENQLGQIKQGLRADMVLLAANPLESLDNFDRPKAVVKQGHWLDESALLALREHAIETQSLWDELVLLLSNY